MKIQIIAVTFCSVALGACATQQYQSAANAQAEVQVEVSEPVEGATEAAPADVVTAPVDVVDETDRDRVICKRVVVTGSRFAKRRCHKWSEWKAMEDETQDSIRRMQRGPGGLNNN